MSDRGPAPLADFPLAGGQQGASIALHPLLCAEVSMSPNWFHRERGPLEALKAIGVGIPRSRLMTIPIPAFLLEHPSAGPVLVDTGMHASVARGGLGRVRNLGPIGLMMSRHANMDPEQTVVAQLRARGVDPADIELIVMTHMHFDHASALCDFPKATVLLDKREWDAAWARGSSLNGYTTAQFDPRPSYRTIDLSAAPVGSDGPFERTLDVFGDGTLTLAATPGHTAGHMSLIVRLEHGEALLTGDAAYTLATIRENERPWLMHDRGAFEHSLRQIQAYDRDNPDAIVIPGHDMQAFKAACARLDGT